MPSKLGFWGIKPAIPLCKLCATGQQKKIEKKEVNWTYIVKILKIFVKILKPQNWEKTRIGELG
jgi:hypothetical protein